MLLSAWFVFFVINGATFVVCSAEPLLWRPSSDLETGKDPICCVDTEWEGRMFIDWATVFIDQVGWQTIATIICFCLFVCLFVCLFCLFVCLFVCDLKIQILYLNVYINVHQCCKVH